MFSSLLSTEITGFDMIPFVTYFFFLLFLRPYMVLAAACNLPKRKMNKQAEVNRPSILLNLWTQAWYY